MFDLIIATLVGIEYWFLFPNSIQWLFRFFFIFVCYWYAIRSVGFVSLFKRVSCCYVFSIPFNYFTMSCGPIGTLMLYFFFVLCVF